ncbi:hypothetical protein Ciccas_010865 [Cichlidogyrus casuarinus]|uniref:Dihydroprymidine dehydrogenase domain-containing protein n=1 Tax=Cichlidogyrus casuarinus TaxID=1844966 RepID=A0ABD2PXJ9_9PLAT
MTRPDEKIDKLRGFVKYKRNPHPYKSTRERTENWNEVHNHQFVRQHLKKQAARCMDCGVPFCQSENFGCPLGNLIPNWNDLVYKDAWKEAHVALAQTNNFPEFTGRVCPAPCEAACVLGINAAAVTIKNIECAIADKAWDQGWNQPKMPEFRTGKRVAVIGSGPSGLACAAQLNQAGHQVTVFERRNLPGGLLRYGIPTMKLERAVVNRRIEQMRAEGVEFRCSTQVGDGQFDRNRDLRSVEEQLETIEPAQLLRQFHAVVLCLGATWPRDIPIPSEP